MTGRWWALALAALMFLAGMATANLMENRGSQTQVSYQLDAQRLTEEFQLSPKRAKHLRALLHRYHLEVQNTRDRHLSALNTGLGMELDGVAERYRSIIRDKVLPPKQRGRFDRMLAGESSEFPPR